AHGCPWLSFSRHAVTAPRARKVRVAGVATVHALRCFPVNNRENTGGAPGGGRSAERAPTARHVEVAPSIVITIRKQWSGAGDRFPQPQVGSSRNPRDRRPGRAQREPGPIATGGDYGSPLSRGRPDAEPVR